MFGISTATIGLTGLYQILNGQQNWPAGLIFGFYCLLLGFSRINRTTQSIEVTETEIIYQSAWKVTRVPWQGIAAYIFLNERFVALNKQQGKILLDINLRSEDKTDWPVKECAQVKERIQRKMNEVGACRESIPSLHYNYKNRIKP